MESGANRPDTRTSASIPEQQAGFDFDALLRRWGNNKALIALLLEKFRTQATRQLAEMEQAAAARDAETLALLAHNMKGAASYLEAARVRSGAAALEQQARDNDFTQVDDGVAALRAAVEAWLAAAAARRVDGGE